MIKVVISEARIEEVVTIEEFLGALSGNLGAVVKIMIKLVVDEEGNYLPEKEATALVMKSGTMGDLRKFAQQIAGDLRDALVSPPSAGE